MTFPAHDGQCLRWRRTASRKRRLIRLRVTAGPASRETTNANRGTGTPAFVSRAAHTTRKPSKRFRAEAPSCITCRMASGLFNRNCRENRNVRPLPDGSAFKGTTTITCWRPERSNACVPWRGDVPGRRDHFWSTSACEIRDRQASSYSMVEMYASSFPFRFQSQDLLRYTFGPADQARYRESTWKDGCECVRLSGPGAPESCNALCHFILRCYF